ncbi:actin-3-like [Hypanus sabinus]|uniref:actin-3-like n=1 Tax=Hypanus sabinus TaxID=79690 RepID=UPI0028C47818|nr:actin-3-like [Hypanus sabinus]
MEESKLHIKKFPVSVGVLRRKYPSSTSQTVKSQPSNISAENQPARTIREVREIRALMIDLGTGYIKAGLAGRCKPAVTVSSIVGRPMQRSVKTGDNRKESFVGRELTAPAELRLSNPLYHGVVVDWDGAETVLDYVLAKELKAKPEDHAVMVADPPLSPITNREKMAELLFETFGFPALHIARQSVLSIYAYGCTSGLVVDCGHGYSSVVPIHEGYIIPHIATTVNYAGNDLTKYLMNLLNQNGHMLSTNDYQTVEYIKHKYCCTAADFETELCEEPRESSVQYQLPDGKVITIDKEKIKCPEALFNPAFMGSSEPGLHTIALNVINKCDSSILEEMSRNILLCGGSSMFPGFPVRFRKELRKLAQDMNLQVRAIPIRRYSVWFGGSILSCLKIFQQLWISKKDYDEHGPIAVYHKYF